MRACAPWDEKSGAAPVKCPLGGDQQRGTGGPDRPRDFREALQPHQIGGGLREEPRPAGQGRNARLNTRTGRQTRLIESPMRPILKLALWLGGFFAAATIVEDIMASHRKIYVAFDYENDRHYKRLLEAWHANDEFDLRFNDGSSGEVQTSDVAKVKGALTAKIREADVVLVLVGREANRPHRDRAQIGFKNWINFEVARAKEAGKRLVAVKLDKSFESPEQLSGASASWAMSFTEAAIIKALREA